MSVDIIMFYPRSSHVYYGGDEITSYLDILGPLDYPDAAVTLTFAGYAETVTEIKDRTLRDKQIFFQTKQQLFQGAFNLQAGENRTFQFKLLLPEQTEPSWGQPKVKYSIRKELFAQGPHAIPPSAAFSGNLPQPWTALVAYRLYAEINGEMWGMTTVRARTGQVTVAASPAQTRTTLEHANTECDARSKTLTYASSHLLEGNANKRRSVMTWFSDKLDASGIKAVFSFTARTATTLSAGKDIPIQITLNYDSAASTLPSIPEFCLLELKYKLKAITNIVYRGFLENCNRDRTSIFKRQMQFLQMPLIDGQNLNIGINNIETGDLQYLPLDTALVAPFKTYNISRAYQVEITIVFLCGGKQMTAKFKWDTVEIVFNEMYHLRPATQLARSNGGGTTVQGVAQVSNLVALTLLTSLGV